MRDSLPTILQLSSRRPACSLQHGHCEPNVYTERLIYSGICKVTQPERHRSNWNMSMFCSSVTPSNSSALYVYNYATNSTTVPSFLYPCTIIYVGSNREASLYTHALKCFFAEVPRIF